MIASLYFVWHAWQRRTIRLTVKRPAVIRIMVLLLMLSWLWTKAQSVTAVVCFCMGLAAFALAAAYASGRSGLFVSGIVWSAFTVGAAAVSMGWQGVLAFLGRDTTLTGRTAIWTRTLASGTDQMFGTGFDSYWLGDRGAAFWSDYTFTINQSHNGYLETYLNLGIVGLVLLLVTVLDAARRAYRGRVGDEDFRLFRLIFLALAMLYNILEASFLKLGPTWFLTLLVIIQLPLVPVARRHLASSHVEANSRRVTRNAAGSESTRKGALRPVRS
jgi:O-antigen ligase